MVKTINLKRGWRFDLHTRRANADYMLTPTRPWFSVGPVLTHTGHLCGVSVSVSGQLFLAYAWQETSPQPTADIGERA